MTTEEYRKAIANTFDPGFRQGYTAALLDISRILPFAERVCGRLTSARLRSFLEFAIEHRVELRDNFKTFSLGYDKENGKWYTRE